MGRSEKKKHKHRSRSRSKERDTSRHKHKKNKRSHSDESTDDSSSSTDRQRHSKHKSHHHHKSKSSSQEGSDRHHHRRDDDGGRRKMPTSVEEMEQYREERQKQKNIMKILETPEEKRARRMAKKESKERKRKEKMGWDEEYMGYTNADNPFGDEHLLDTFVWGKKMEKEGNETLSKQELETLQKQKMAENSRELEKVKKRRIEREKENEERDKERENLQREKETEYFREWEKQEDHFHLNQAKLRSKIRVNDGRAKPIDLLAQYISAEDDDLAVEMQEPYTYLNGLTITDLEDLIEDIKVYMELEEGKNVDYWRDITIIAEDELGKLRRIDPSIHEHVGDRREGIHQAVHSDVVSVFRAKSLSQLKILETEMKNKLKGGEGVDVGYWESLLQQLKAHMARTRLRERHQYVLQAKLFKLKQEQGIESQPVFPIIKTVPQPEPGGSGLMPPPAAPSSSQMPPPPPPPPGSDPTPSTSQDGAEPGTGQEGKEEEEEVAVLTEKDLGEVAYEEYEAGRYSPELVKIGELAADAIVYHVEADMKRLEFARRQVMSTGMAKDETEKEFEKRAREGMNDDEAQFSVEVPIEQQTVLWSDKYRPRKPRFFNRVHTGFEWNKYNQTHYDIDNPPPKIVQGYKFNIFYPDLIEKTNTPEYTLTPCDNSKDFSTLRFHAGPPYEDIGFKIVNREWEYSYKRGFRCQFHNNIFQLWFHFKRYRYRR